MFERPTRLELVIIFAALLVLIFCSRPPTSGNADIRIDTAPAFEVSGPAISQSEPGTFSTPSGPSSVSAVDTDLAGSDSAAAEETSAESDVPPPPETKRIAMVDARNAGNLNYKNVMYGEVKVRWVWNGTKLVPHKVVEVKEPSGVVSVWSFDDHENILLSELPGEQAPQNE